jgi:hypothetical protein
MYVLCRSKFGSPHSHKAKKGEMPINETLHRRERAIRAAQAATEEREQQVEDLTVANETLREENDRLREALVHVDQYVAYTLVIGNPIADKIHAIIKGSLWTPTTDVSGPDPESF